MITHHHTATVNIEIRETCDRLIRKAFETAAALVRKKALLCEQAHEDAVRRSRSFSDGDEIVHASEIVHGSPAAALREVADAFDELARGEE